MKSLEEITIDNAGVGNWIRWKEFRGTKKEVERFGKIIEKKDGGFVVEYESPAIAFVHPEKIEKVMP